MDTADFAAKRTASAPRASLDRRIVEGRIYQTKETHAFARADKLLGDLETHPAAKRVPCEKIGSVRLHPSDFGDAIGSHRLDRTGNAVLSIQRRWLQAKYRTVALKIAKQMAVMHHASKIWRAQGKVANLSRRREVAPVIEMQRCLWSLG